MELFRTFFDIFASNFQDDRTSPLRTGYSGEIFESSPPKNLADKFGSSPTKFQDFPAKIFWKFGQILVSKIQLLVYLKNLKQNICKFPKYLLVWIFWLLWLMLDTIKSCKWYDEDFTWSFKWICPENWGEDENDSTKSTIITQAVEGESLESAETRKRSAKSRLKDDHPNFGHSKQSRSNEYQDMKRTGQWH